MSTQVQSLPDELLAVVLRTLPKLDLKNARLTCMRWSNIGAESLFQRVYFAPRQHIMQQFLNITEHPVFGRNIEELVYDGSLFQHWYLDEQFAREIFDYNILEKRNLTVSYPRDGSLEQRMLFKVENGLRTEELEGQFRRDFAQYPQHLADQEEILGNGHDFEALSTGLQRMPRLMKITLMCSFLPGNAANGNDDSHNHYQDRLNILYRGHLTPSPWFEGDRIEGWLTSPVLTEDRIWDCRGVNHLFRAISSHCNSIQELKIGCSDYGASLLWFHPSAGNLNHLQHIAKSLTSLRLSFAAYSDYCRCTEKDYFEGLACVLRQSSKLKVLAINMIDEFYDQTKSIFVHQWPKLETLEITTADFEVCELRALIVGAKDTLKRLAIRDIELPDSESWQILADDLGGLMKLDHLTLSVLHCRRQCPRLIYNIQGTANLAKRMVSWVDVQKLDVIMMEAEETVIVRVREEATSRITPE